MATQISDLPSPPSRSEPSTFSAKTDAFLSAMPTFVAQTNLVALEMEAALASVSAGVAQWNPATAYTIGEYVFSPIDFLTYRRITNGTTATDPSLDVTNWLLSGKLVQDTNPQLGGDLDLNGHDIPVSATQQTALNLKQDADEKGAANGYAPLDAGSLLPTENLPVIPAANLPVIPAANLPLMFDNRLFGGN